MEGLEEVWIVLLKKKNTIPQEPACENINGEIHGIKSLFTGH